METVATNDTTTRRNRHLVDQYLGWMQEHERRSSNTIYKYSLSYRIFLEHVGATGLNDVTLANMEAYLRRPRTKLRGPNVAPATIKREIMELRSLYKWLGSRNLIVGDPTVRLLEEAPTVHNEAPHPAPLGAWQALWFGDLAVEERVAFGLGMFCGMRRHEITGLKVDQFVDAPTPMITNVKRKGGKLQGIRWSSAVELYATKLAPYIGAPQSFTDALDELLELRLPGQALLAPWRNDSAVTYKVHEMPKGVINPDQFNKRLVRALRRNGLDGNEFSPHALRHSFCTNLIDVGVPIQVVSRLAGHSSLNVTMRYVDTGEDPLADLLEGVGDEGQGLVINRFRMR